MPAALLALRTVRLASIIWLAAGDDHGGVFRAARKPITHGLERPVRVTICMTRMPRIAFMYRPAWSTLVAGFKAYARMRPPRAFQLVAEPNKCRALNFNATAPHIFIWVGLQGHTRVPWLQLKARGVLTVYYRTEPNEPCIQTTQLSETWEYTHANWGGACERPAPRSRYLPPGAPTRLAASLRGAGHPAMPSLAFVGRIWAGRAKCFWSLSDAVFPGKIQILKDLWTEERWQQAMTNMTAVVNLHKHCGDSTQPLEAFRAVKLLAHGCIVLSERSNAQDEAAFEGMVTFASVEDLPAVWARVSALRAVDRAAAGATARTKFLAAFKPKTLFENAGVYELLDSLRSDNRRPPSSIAPVVL